ncbi:putative metal tolerance protein 3 protein [Rosellinia necatrix]|uniref:Putative metal tolerance protein 3 protein n=1 Tax=Rosellinia necatrix TaxID=77044 RepID=A0A1W2TB36_ROSNE|nr:putative metal tolerance protein 3 protein [Rosellinia necatrix]
MARAAPFHSVASLVLLLLVSACMHASVASAAAIQFRTVIGPRQTTTTPAPAALPVSCAEYSRVANLSTIALNSTLRAAFLRSSSLGTFPAAAILDAEAPKLAGLTFDATLNEQCGNLSALAAVEADRNLTAGTVAGMKILDAPGIAPDNVVLPVLCIILMFIMGAPATML